MIRKGELSMENIEMAKKESTFEEKYIKKMKFKETVVDNMIQNIDNGISGFSYSKGPLCLNDRVIKEATRKVEDYPYICPWNKKILYGTENCSIQSGCPRTVFAIVKNQNKKKLEATSTNEGAKTQSLFCGIKVISLLSKNEQLKILKRFKKNLQNGVYKDEKNVPPLLTKKEIETIQERIELQEEETRAKRIAALVEKHPDWKEDLEECYGTDIAWNGTGVHFAPESKSCVDGAEDMSYDEYIEAQMRSIDGHRHDLAMCEHYNNYGIFRGRVSKVNGEYVCFEKLYVQTGDGEEDFYGEEDHVWVHKKQFNGCKLNIGNCLQFEGFINRYVRQGNGLPQIDYGIKTVKAFKRL